ncbi:transposase [Rhodoferax lacus]|uniref:Transposase n=1 Tax=Rhodoferax lacus TaxID=2184758 RepID=A0A3E1RH49_9BURK|nr:transposase [Rhodoferax lacus]RFO97930.1 transposase [Rhodoferax lacus]
MARLPRLSFAGLPHHVIQRGHNGQPIFLQTADYQLMLDLLLEYARKFQVAVHAYVLLPNHIHLLLSPEAVNGLPLMLQSVGRRYVRYFNDQQGRSGTLWDGRYRCTVMQPERFVLPCMSYMDLNPVRAGLSDSAADYAWSSHGHYIGRRVDRLVTPHAQFWGLGNTPFAREDAYAQLVQAGTDASQQSVLTDATLKGWALGDAAFVQALQKDSPRRLVKGRAGRPVRALLKPQ